MNVVQTLIYVVMIFFQEKSSGLFRLKPHGLSKRHLLPIELQYESSAIVFRSSPLVGFSKGKNNKLSGLKFAVRNYRYK